jgi:hypothetical protein
MVTRLIDIDEHGNSPLELHRAQVGRYGDRLRQGQQALLWDGAAQRTVRVEIVELFTHIHTRPAGGASYVCAEVEIVTD